MRRREFIAGLGGAVAWPRTARTQQAAVPVVGVLNQAKFNEEWRARIEAFRKGLAETGFVEDRTVAIEYRWAENRYEGPLAGLGCAYVLRPGLKVAGAELGYKLIEDILPPSWQPHIMHYLAELGR